MNWGGQKKERTMQDTKSQDMVDNGSPTVKGAWFTGIVLLLLLIGVLSRDLLTRLGECDKPWLWCLA
jgi:hypothetical protein